MRTFIRFIPHLIAIPHIPLLLAIGYTMNWLPAAAYIGSAAGSAEDPILILLAVLLGLAASKSWQLLLAVIAVSTGLHFYVAFTSEFATRSLFPIIGKIAA